MGEEKAEKAAKKEKSTPLVIVVSSPSGGGKTTIVKKLINKMPGIRQSVSYTTRPPRSGEENGKDYIFISEEEFDRKIQDGEFLEWENNFGHYYGTSSQQIAKAMSEGDDVIMSIDVRGGLNVKAKMPESVSVFIMPPSIEELVARLEKRNTEAKDQRETRLKEARREITTGEGYDHSIVNKDLEQATEELRRIIEKERKNRE